MRRRQFLASAIVSMLLPLPAFAARKPVITVVLKSMRNQFFVAMAEGARQHHAKHANDYTLILEGIQDEADVKGQELIIQRSLARHDDALIVAPADSSLMIPLLLKAINRKMLVVNMDNKLDERALVQAGVNIPFVGPSNYSGARLVGDYVLHKLKPGSKVAIIEGIPGSINAKARSDGYRKSIVSAEMVLVGMRWGYWETPQAHKAARELLNEKPDIAAFLCGNDNMALGVVQALAEKQLTGKVLVAGYDNIPAVQPYLADQRISATADQHPALQVQHAIDLVRDAIKNKTDQANLKSIVQTPVQLIKKG